MSAHVSKIEKKKPKLNTKQQSQINLAKFFSKTACVCRKYDGLLMESGS